MMTLLDDNFDDEKSNNYDKTGHQISLLCTVHCTQVLCYNNNNYDGNVNDDDYDGQVPFVHSALHTDFM